MVADDGEQIYIDEGGEGIYVYYTGPADSGLQRSVTPPASLSMTSKVIFSLLSTFLVSKKPPHVKPHFSSISKPDPFRR